MAIHQYVILSRAVPGQEAEFERWYDEQHLGDVARVPGVVSARRFKIGWQNTTALDAPQWQSLAIYEIDAADPKAVIAAIGAVAGSAVMPLSDAMTQDGMVQLLAGPARPAV